MTVAPERRVAESRSRYPKWFTRSVVGGIATGACCIAVGAVVNKATVHSNDVTWTYIGQYTTQSHANPNNLDVLSQLYDRFDNQNEHTKQLDSVEYKLHRAGEVLILLSLGFGAGGFTLAGASETTRIRVVQPES